jgi:hypothetical protein
MSDYNDPWISTAFINAFGQRDEDAWDPSSERVRLNAFSIDDDIRQNWASVLQQLMPPGAFDGEDV